MVASSGTSFAICFVSSTCVTVHSVHPGASSAFTAALFRNLMEAVASTRNLLRLA
uniref:Uncharacterized protein n=1 Tax=Arundo donax TaxID=35708 RepID=A0A0A9G8H2_ARUDO